VAILDSTFNPAIRMALHSSLTTEALPDAMIALNIYLGAAEAEILRRDPDAASRTGTELIVVQNAAVLMTAALLAPAVELMQSEYIPGGGYRYQRPEVNWKERAALLRQRAESELTTLLSPSSPSLSARPTLFAVASRTFRSYP